MHSQTKKVIPHNQFGLLNQHSTIHAINKLLSDVNYHLANDDLIGATLIDLEKAFGTVWLDGLIYILMENKYPEHLIGLIWRMISDRSFYIWDGNRTSTAKFKIKEELQQGTVNSPTLFNIFTNHILNAFKLNGDNNIYSLAHGDDLIIYVAAKYPGIAKDLLLITWACASTT